MHSDLIPYLRSAERTRIIALDLAKNMTGIAVCEVPAIPGPNDELHWIKHGTIHIDKRNDKYMFLVAEELGKLVALEIQKQRNSGANVLVIIEHPIFGQMRSEQQYMIFQTVLSACAKESVNVSTISPGLLKNFIKHQIFQSENYLRALNSQRQKPAKVRRATKQIIVDKDHIKHIYADVTYPANKMWFPKPEDIKNDDERDALYLAWFGATFIADMPDLKWGRYIGAISCSKTVEDLNNLPVVKNTLCLDERPFNPVNARTYANVVYGFPEGLADVLKSYRAYQSRRFVAKLEFLFQQENLVHEYYVKLRDLDPKAAEAWLATRQDKKDRKITDKAADGWILTPNYDGRLFLHVPAKLAVTDFV